MGLPIIAIRILLAGLGATLAVIGISIGSASSSVWIGILSALGVLLVVLVPVRLLIAAMGWDRAARTLRPPTDNSNNNNNSRKPTTPRWRHVSTSVALRCPWMWINNAILWHEDDAGLHIKLIEPFGLGAKPIYIPWHRIAELRPLRGTWGAHELIADEKDPLPVRIFILKDIAKAEIERRNAARPQDEPPPA